MGEGRLAGAGNSGEADEEAEREIRVELLQIVAGRAAEFELSLAGLAALGRNGDRFAAVEPRKSADGVCEFEVFSFQGRRFAFGRLFAFP